MMIERRAMAKRALQGSVFIALLLTAGLILSPVRSAAGPLIIDDFACMDSAAARLAWINTGAPVVTMATAGEWGTDQVMVLTCD